MVKSLPAMQEIQEKQARSPSQEDPLEKKMATHSKYFCMENPHRPKSLAGYSPWGRKESDTTKHSTTHNVISFLLIPEAFSITIELYFFKNFISGFVCAC